MENNVSMDIQEENLERVAEHFEGKVAAEIDKLDNNKPRNRAERRARRFTTQGRAKQRHLDNLSAAVRKAIYLEALQKVQRVNNKIQEEMENGQSSEADMGI